LSTPYGINNNNNNGLVTNLYIDLRKKGTQGTKDNERVSGKEVRKEWRM